VQNNGSPTYAAHPAAEQRERRFFQAFGAHPFRNSFENPVTYAAGGFGSDVPLGNPGSAGCNYQACFGRHLYDCCLDLLLLVGHHRSTNDGELLSLEGIRQGRSGNIFSIAASGRIANREDGGSERLRYRGGHLLPPLVRCRALIRPATASLP